MTDTTPQAAGTAGPEEERAAPATVEGRLRLGSGFAVEERAGVVRQFARLDERLKTFRAGAVDLELSVKERDLASQRVVLECWIVGWPRLVATSEERDLAVALAEVRDDLVRQLNDAATRREPRNNRQLRRR